MYPLLRFKLVASLLVFSLLLSCQNHSSDTSDSLSGSSTETITDEALRNIVERSYQYVAMYNVNNKFSNAHGWNVVFADTRLKDHTMRDIARPNNDTYYVAAALDLRNDAMIITVPVLESDYASLMITAYDHYVEIPKSTRNEDFIRTEKILVYSDRTQGYHGEPVKGIDDIFKASGDFVSAVIRVMPHASEPARNQAIKKNIQNIQLESLSEYLHKPIKELTEISFPQVGTTNTDVYENNFLEVMQFVFNHVSFDPAFVLDKEVLAALKPLGVEPGLQFDPGKVRDIDGKRIRTVAEEIEKHYLTLMEKGGHPSIQLLQFQPKGTTDDLEILLGVSVTGPIGMPRQEAIYEPIVTVNKEPLNAMNDYVVSMTSEALPPAGAFWSLTVYDQKNGFFIPNERKKYSVGENAGMKLNAQGGIDIYISSDQPEGVPPENWLPVNRTDENIDLILRIYEPDLEAMKKWKPPVASKYQTNVL